MIALLSRWWLGISLVVGGLTLIGVVSLGLPFEEAKADVKGDKDATAVAPGPAKAVDEIINRNKAPEMFDRNPKGGLFAEKPDEPRPRKVPIYAENYDWDEEARVIKSLKSLYQDTSPQMWEEQVRRENDKRYSITVVDEVPNGPIGDEWIYVRSVGEICHSLADWRLLYVFQRHRLPLANDLPSRLMVNIENLSTWRKERANKSFDRLQIEVCEMALDALAKDDRFSKEVKADVRKKIEADIETLKKTKQPIMEEIRFQEATYTPEHAKRVREAIAKGFKGNLLFRAKD